MILVFASPALKRWANEFRRYAADTGTLYAANLSAANRYATNFRRRIELQTQDSRMCLDNTGFARTAILRQPEQCTVAPRRDRTAGVNSTSTATAGSRRSNPASPLLWFHERFGTPQIYALLLLTAMLAQGLFLASRIPLSTFEMAYIHQTGGEMGVLETANGAMPPMPQAQSPLVSFLSTLPIQTTIPTDADSPFWRILFRIPFLLVGALLGASLWYVSRRLYGNIAGYTALILFVFSPPVLLRACSVAPDMVAAWGTFGCIFTGIAVAHTLYAPREVVLWNWRRILLLGTSIGVATAAAFSTFVAVPLALAFMLYLVPHRRRAAIAILAASCAVSTVVLLSTFHFDLTQLRVFMRAGYLSTGGGFVTKGVLYALGGFVFNNGPAFTALFIVSMVTYFAWRRVRFFGTTAPLLTFLFLVVLAVSAGHRNVMVLLAAALPFLCVFMAGVTADLLEIRNRWTGLIHAALLAVLCSHALFSLSGLWRLIR
jgi:hypothetical protein